MEPDFSGYASKAGVRCTDGTTILAHAFRDKDGGRVPLVWNHSHDDPSMIIGHAEVFDRPDGTYIKGYFNNSAKALEAKELVRHGDIDQMSVYANRIIKRGNDVVHGNLQEVSLVLAGANSGARIDTVSIRHGDGTISESTEDVIIFSNEKIVHGDSDSDSKDRTVQDVLDTLTEEQATAVAFVLDKLENPDGENVKHADKSDDSDEEEDKSDEDDSEDKDDSDKSEKSDKTGDSDKTGESSDEEKPNKDDEPSEEVKHSDTNQEKTMSNHRVFDTNIDNKDLEGKGSILSHSDITAIFASAGRLGSVREAFIKHADAAQVAGQDYGIGGIDNLFPDAKNILSGPEFVKRRTEWVAEILGRVSHVPNSRIKTLSADITADEARARGYVKGTFKKEEVFGIIKRVTTPTTVYKKQKLDRDDVLDATELNVILFLKMEMRLMLEEEIARAILIGDGRDASHEDKIKEPLGEEGSGIRSVANDHSIYAHQVQLKSGTSVLDRVDELLRARMEYLGTGTPTLFVSIAFITDILLVRDRLDHRIYSSMSELATVLMADKIVPVELMNDKQDLVGIYLNPVDYAVGTDRGGEISFFDDFDINLNQELMLLETRMSGALKKIRSAIVVRRALGTIVTPEQPSFEVSTNTITIPTTEGVIYKLDGEIKSGAQVIAKDAVVEATPAEGYDFKAGIATRWVYTFNEG